MKEPPAYFRAWRKEDTAPITAAEFANAVSVTGLERRNPVCMCTCLLIKFCCRSVRACVWPGGGARSRRKGGTGEALAIRC